jgi:DNA-binding NtrC family response regulator
MTLTGKLLVAAARDGSARAAAREAIRAALGGAAGHRGAAARALGVSKATLYRLLHTCGLLDAAEGDHGGGSRRPILPTCPTVVESSDT